MARERVKLTQVGRASRTIVVIILLIPMLCGIIAGNYAMTADKAGCPMVQSFGAQIGGDSEQPSDTADNCRAAIDAKHFGYILFGILGVYMLCGGALMTLIAITTISGRRRKPVVVVVQDSAVSTAVPDRLRSMVDGTVIAGDPSAEPDARTDN